MTKYKNPQWYQETHGVIATLQAALHIPYEATKARNQVLYTEYESSVSNILDILATAQREAERLLNRVYEDHFQAIKATVEK